MNDSRQSLATRRPSKWSRGKLYYFEKDYPVLVPTNYATLNYLNLEESSFLHYGPFDEQVPFGEREYLCCLGPNALKNPLVDDPEEMVLRVLLQKYRPKISESVNKTLEHFHSLMQLKSEIACLLSLLKRWNVSKYKELLKTSLHRHLPRQRKEELHLHLTTLYELFLLVLTICCEDSLFIVEVVSIICSCTLDMYCISSDVAARIYDSIAVCLSPYQYVFFLCHLQRANLKFSQFEDHVPKQHLLFNAFDSSDIKLMKLSLELEGLPGYSNQILSLVEKMEYISQFEEFRVVPAHWPRKKDKLRRESFNSVEFYATFTHIVIWAGAFFGYHEVKPFIQLLWKAIPTPYLPFEDMLRSVEFGKIFEDDFEKTLLRKLSRYFEGDFPTEFKPRSLKHLSRCAARQQFRSPEVISSLALPETLKKYLLLEI